MARKVVKTFICKRGDENYYRELWDDLYLAVPKLLMGVYEEWRQVKLADN